MQFIKAFSATALTVAGLVAGSISGVQAASIAQLDLSAQTFSIDTLATNPVVTGLSNGIGYTFTAVSPFWNAGSSASGGQSYNDIPGRSFDDIHAGADFTIVFDQPITSLLVALGNDNLTGDGPEFDQTMVEGLDINPVDLGGGDFRLAITDPGGALAYFEFLSPITQISHTNSTIGDGWDMSFFANAANAGTGPGYTPPPIPGTPVPVPAALPLLAAALGLTAVLRRRKG